MEKEFIKMSSRFGHEVVIAHLANVLGKKVVIIPETENEVEFYLESKKIKEVMSYFNRDLIEIDFQEKEEYKEKSWDFVQSLRDGTLDNEFIWDAFFSKVCGPKKGLILLPQFDELWEEDLENILVVPQKLVSDGKCGVSAKEQSLPLEVFDIVNDLPLRPILGQHFHKTNDLDKIEELKKMFNLLYIPGETEHNEVFGVRGVAHENFFWMFSALTASIGIAGTHTWIMLAMFPDIPQVIFYNKKGIERWSAIEKMAQKHGRKVFCIGFDENSNVAELKQNAKTLLQEIILQSKI